MISHYRQKAISAADPLERLRGESVPARRSTRKQRRTTISLNMAPMIDITFLLFSFSLVTATFEPAEGILASQLPRDSAAPSVALPLTPIIVRLELVGVAEDDVTISVDRIAQQPSNYGELVAVLKGLQQQPGFDEKTPVVIVAENDVSWDHVVQCWNAALRADCTSIAFAEPPR